MKWPERKYSLAALKAIAIIETIGLVPLHLQMFIYGIKSTYCRFFTGMVEQQINRYYKSN